MLHPYPTSFAEAAVVVVDKLRGKPSDPATVRHAAWHLAGYALAWAQPAAEPIAWTFGNAPLDSELAMKTDAELADMLDVRTTELKASHGAVVGFPWLLLLSVLFEVLRRLWPRSA